MLDPDSPLSSIITGTESTLASSSRSSLDDDLTPFPSPLLLPTTLPTTWNLDLSASSLAGLSLTADGAFEQEVDDKKIVTDQERAKALELKAQANKAFAGMSSTTAIALDPHEPTFWNNRAMCKAKLEEHGAAIADATKAVALNPKYVKAYYRRGTSYLAIMRPTQAVPDFKKALSLEPGNKDIREQLNATVKLIRRIEFEKAISVGETESASTRCMTLISEGSCPLENPTNFPLPSVSSDPKARYEPTLEFVNSMVEKFKDGGKVPRRLAWEIILGVKEIVEKDKTLVEVEVPEGVVCDVIGDTHGQFFDVCNLFSMIGPPSDTHMIVVNGDMVDRGSWSLETVLTFFAWKWLRPDRVFINRGNHETNDMNKVYGFEGEVKTKLGEMTYKLFADVFTALPIATLITAGLPPSNLKSEGSQPAILSPEGRKRYFVVHGGIFSKDGITLEEISKVERFGRQPGQEGIMCEMLWTDPQDQQGRGPSKRGVGVGFGPDVTRRWCELNHVTAIIRSHEVRADGYAVEHDGLCITTFSCPNYCDTTGNKGAYVRMQADGQLGYHQFDAVPHPAVRPMAYSSGFFPGLM
ncbi:protein phosphatase 5 [Tremella mesenterica]|uniref:Serine/threonine-protein phosphatase n=1 Tax=Tremella mesenterica TaxID=5217 RepID=A0A4Q1BGI4_TREME|nr:protein phosphatase 5 [Tremella mesenterica]